MWESTNKRIMDQVSLGIKPDPTSKTTSTKRAGRVAQVVGHLPSKHKALSLNPSTERREEGREGRRERGRKGGNEGRRKGERERESKKGRKEGRKEKCKE
jgi:hypothetical protein